MLLTADLETTYAAPISIDELWRSISVPVGVGLLFVVAVIAYLRWWRPILVEDKPVNDG